MVILVKEVKIVHYMVELDMQKEKNGTIILLLKKVNIS